MTRIMIRKMMRIEVEIREDRTRRDLTLSTREDKVETETDRVDKPRSLKMMTMITIRIMITHKTPKETNLEVYQNHFKTHNHKANNRIRLREASLNISH